MPLPPITFPDTPFGHLEIGSPTTDKRVIKKSFHKLALKCHPDKVTDASKKAASESRFKQINEAYSKLSDMSDAELARFAERCRSRPAANATRPVPRAPSSQTRPAPSRQHPSPPRYRPAPKPSQSRQNPSPPRYRSAPRPSQNRPDPSPPRYRAAGGASNKNAPHRNPPPPTKPTPPRRASGATSSSASERVYRQLSGEETRELFSKVRNGRIGEVIQMRNAGIFDPNIRDEFGNTPLIVAAQNNQLGLMRFFMVHKANLDAQNCRGNTALHFAFAYNYITLANHLMAAGADKTLVNSTGHLPGKWCP